MSEFADWYTCGVTKYESVLAQALELTEEERELLATQIHPGLSKDYAWTESPAYIAELERRVRHAGEHPETLVDWEDAEREIFGDLAER